VILSAVNITVGYGNTFLVENLSFSLDMGEILILSGENGSGKTSLMRSLMGSLSILEGDLFIADGYNLMYSSPQYTGLYLSLTARQNLSLYIKNPSHQIEKFKIPHPDIPCKNLSLGQKTMVSLAISLAKPSNILLIDEAMNSLDIENQTIILRAIEEHPAPSILVSHRQMHKGLTKEPLVLEL